MGLCCGFVSIGTEHSFDYFSECGNFAVVGRLHWTQYGNTKCFSGETSQTSSLLLRHTYSANCVAIYWFYSHVYTSQETDRLAGRSHGTMHACSRFSWPLGSLFAKYVSLFWFLRLIFAFIVNAFWCGFHFGASKIGVHQVPENLAQRVNGSKWSHNNNNETDSIISIIFFTFSYVRLRDKITLSPNDGNLQRSGFCQWSFLEWAVVLHRFSRNYLSSSMRRRSLWFRYWWHICNLIYGMKEFGLFYRCLIISFLYSHRFYVIICTRCTRCTSTLEPKIG